MKKLLVVLGLSVVAMAGKCGGGSESTTSSEKPAEEFPAKEEGAAPAQEVPSYDQQQAAPAAGQEEAAPSTPAPAEATPAPAGEPSKAPSND